jgi:hypothetical protein
MRIEDPSMGGDLKKRTLSSPLKSHIVISEWSIRVGISNMCVGI